MYILEVTFFTRSSSVLMGMLISMVSSLNLNMGHGGSKTRSWGQMKGNVVNTLEVTFLVGSSPNSKRELLKTIMITLLVLVLYMNYDKNKDKQTSKIISVVGAKIPLDLLLNVVFATFLTVFQSYRRSFSKAPILEITSTRPHSFVPN